MQILHDPYDEGEATEFLEVSDTLDKDNELGIAIETKAICVDDTYFYLTLEEVKILFNHLKNVLKDNI